MSNTARLLRVSLHSCLLSLALTLMPTLLPAQTYTDLHDFDCTIEGCQPSYPAVLAQGRDGNLYGTASAGGTSGMGTVFKISPAGVVTTLYNFSGLDGQNPDGGLTLGPDGFFYGSTERGGAHNLGTIFKISPTGVLISLHSFANTGDGSTPHGAPVIGRNGKFYGTTCSQNAPWIAYSITPAGVFTQIAQVPPCPFGSLILGYDGNFYGTSQVGGTSSQGTVFRMTPAGTVTVLHSFNNTDGAYLYSPLVQGFDLMLYGTTSGGGSGQGGTIFKMKTNGKITLLRQFAATSSTDGTTPFAGLVAVADGNFYGATSGGENSGAVPNGNLFKIDGSGNYSLLYALDGTHGSSEVATQMQHTNGKIYGIADRGGAHQGGAFYRLDAGMHPFVRIVTPFGAAGKTIGILGNGLSGTTSVNFGNASAPFTVVSNTYITATIPADADNGPIDVVTPNRIYLGNQLFPVPPNITSFSPASGPVGTVVTLNGTGMLDFSQITFGGVNVINFTLNTQTSLFVTVPAGAVSGKIVIRGASGSSTSSTSFTVTP